MPASATGTPTTNFGLPTLNTSADAPDGLGINNIVTAIDTALLAVQSGGIAKPTGIVTGEVAVWNGSSFVRSSVTKIAGATNVDFTGAPTYLTAPVKYTNLIDIVSSVAETDILQTAGYTIPANTLGVGGDLRATLHGDYLNNTGGATTLTLKGYWGGVLAFNTGVSFNIATSAARRVFRLQVLLSNLGSTNAQFISGEGVLGVAGGGAFDTPTAVGNLGQLVDIYNGTFAVDTTVAATLRITATLSSSSASHELRIRKSLIEIV